MPPFEFTKKFEALVSKILTYAAKGTASTRREGKQAVVSHRQKLHRANLRNNIDSKNLSLNLSATEIKKINRRLKISLHANSQDIKKELTGISVQSLRKDKWTLWRLFVQQEIKGKNSEITKKALKENHKFKKGETLHVHLWHKKAYWGIGLPHVFRKHKEVYEVGLTQLGKRGRNGIARRYEDGKYYFVNSDGSKGAYAAIFNTKIKILKIKKPRTITRAVKKRTKIVATLPVPKSKQKPKAYEVPYVHASNIDKAKMKLLIEEHHKLFKKGKHNVGGQCEGMSIVVTAKAISKITGKKFHWKSLRWSPLYAATFKVRGKLMQDLKESDFDHIPYGAVFYVARDRPKLTTYKKGRKKRKIAPIIGGSGRHWFIYAGRDANGKAVFIDNHYRKTGVASLATMRRFVRNRIVINIYNAYSAYDGKLTVNSSGKLRQISA